MPSRPFLPPAITWPLLLLLAASSLNTKAMGGAWTLLVITGLWGLWHTRHQTTADSAPWLKTWIMVTALAMILKTVPTLYWGDPWAERHGEIRMLLGAIAIWGLQRWRMPDMHTVHRMADALTVSSALGLVWVLIYGRGQVCTHPIPWAVAMAMVSGWLLTLGLDRTTQAQQRWRWLTGGLLALLAVLASQSRGAFGILIWWSAVLLHHSWIQRHQAHTDLRMLIRILWVSTALLTTVWALSYTPVLQRPLQSLRDATHEIARSQQSAEAGSNSSVGARLYMWQRSQEAIAQSPWIGHGHDGRKQHLATWAAQAQSDEIRQLGHLHNEFLNQLVDHGLWGLASQLAYLLGLLWMVKQLLQARQATAAKSLACIAFMHLSSSLSNVNFAHNYYTTGLSLLILLSLFMAPTSKKGPKAL